MFIAERAGHDDEGHVEPKPTQLPERVHSSPIGEAIIGEHQVVVVACQQLGELPARGGTIDMGARLGVLHLVKYQIRIGLIVLQHQNAQLSGDRVVTSHLERLSAAGHAGPGSFVVIQ